MSKIEIQVEVPSVALFKEAMHLAKAHYEEVELKSDSIPFQMDLDTIGVLIKAGLIEVVTVRKDGVLVGYFANMIGPDVMTGTLAAKELGIYLGPSVRESGVCRDLFSVMESHLKETGVDLQLVMFKAGHKEDLPEKLGYEITEIVYQKIL